MNMKFELEKSLARHEALASLCEQWQPPVTTEVVPLNEAFGRVCAEDLNALVTLPVVRSSRRDGICVRSADFTQGMPDTKSWQRGRDYAQADTGDDFPDEFDAVIAIEHVDFVTADRSAGLILDIDPAEIKAGFGTNSAGSIVQRGTLVVSANTMLTVELVAALAVAGYAQVTVLAQPVIAFMATGSELVPWGSFPQRGQNLEANSLLVTGMAREWGARCVCYPIVKDEPEYLEAALDRALEQADIVLVNGGSSRGEEDYNSRMLERRGTYFQHGVRAVPGRPVGMSIIDGKPVVNMPGPVQAAFLCMDWLVRGLVAHWYQIPAPRRQSVQAIFAQDVQKPKLFERLMRVTLTQNEQGAWICEALPSMGVPQTLACTHGMAVLPLGIDVVPAGMPVTVELLTSLESVE